MQITKSKIQHLSTLILILVAVLLWVLTHSDVIAYYEATYAESAHGNTDPPPGYGVNRSGTGYPIGDCAHCHDTFDDSICGVNQLMLFAPNNPDSQTDNFCFQCHSQINPAPSLVYNYSYAYLFGGASTQYWWDIKKAFCKAGDCNSRHNLSSIQNFIENNAFDWGYPGDANPCSACHNPHLAKRIGSTQYRLPYDPSKSPITRPSERYNNPLNLWGDDTDERMKYCAENVYGGTYQAPYYGDTSDPDWEVSYEPSGNASPSDGSDLPDYTTLCLDCHAKPEMETQFGIVKIDWSSHKHGGRASSYDGGHSKGSLQPPYSDPTLWPDWENTNFVLSCTDCHEPHAGKKASYMLRRFVNGQEVAAEPISGLLCWVESTQSQHYYDKFCIKCHYDFPEETVSWHGSTGGCAGCHNHGEGTYGPNWWGYTF